MTAPSNPFPTNELLLLFSQRGFQGEQSTKEITVNKGKVQKIEKNGNVGID